MRRGLVLLALLTGALVRFVATTPAPARSGQAPFFTAHDGESWFILRRGYPTFKVPSADVLGAGSKQEPPPGQAESTPTPGQWVLFGPQPITTSALPFAGRVTAVAPHPTDANIIYIGTDGAGIWLSQDAGATWASLTDTLPIPHIRSLVIDPVDPRLLYATTIPRAYPTRLLRSTDSGRTWRVSSITTDDHRTVAPGPCAVNVFQRACIPPSSGGLFFDRSRAGSPNTSRIFFVGWSHILRSDNSGDTFHEVFSLPIDLDFAGPDAPNDNSEAEFLRDATIDPLTPSRLYAAVAQPRCTSSSNGACRQAQSTVRLYRSLDGGSHWTSQSIVDLSAYSLSNVRYADPGEVYVPRVRVAVAPTNPDTVAVACRDVARGAARAFVSTNAGSTFAETQQPPDAADQTWPLGLVFSPTDAATFYLSSATVYRFGNIGATFVASANFHVDNISLAFDANGFLLVGGDGGLHKLPPDLSSVTALHSSLPITEFYAVAAHPTIASMMSGGTQDNGTALYRGSPGWLEIVGGDGGDVAFDPGGTTSATTYAEVEWYFDGNSNVYGFYRCTVGAPPSTSSSCTRRSTGIDLSLDGPFIPRFTVDASHPATLWLGAGRLFRTDNRGDNWTSSSPSAAGYSRCWIDLQTGLHCAAGRYFTTVAVAPNNSSVVYAGLLNGDVWITRDRGISWNSIAGFGGLPLPVRPVNDVVVDPLDADTAYVLFSGFDSAGTGLGHIFRTRNAGTIWTRISDGLPDVPVNTLLIDPLSVNSGRRRVLFAGTDLGVFRLDTEDGKGWQPVGTGLPPVIVNRLVYSPTSQMLVAATYGRGVWGIAGQFGR